MTFQTVQILETLLESDLRQFSRQLRTIILLKSTAEYVIDEPDFYCNMLSIFDLLDELIDNGQVNAQNTDREDCASPERSV